MISKNTAGSLAVGFILGGAVVAATVYFMNEREADEDAEAAEKTAVVSPASDSAAAAAVASLARISEDSAKTIALAQIPGGKIESGELENEDGKLIYSFDIKVAGKEGIEEVHVNAITGEVIKKVHESAADEAAEKAKS
jgi:uncharacterized membrane protein YkoI